MRRGPIPPDRAGLIMLAFIVAPIVLRQIKPFVAAAGRAVKLAGETLIKIGEEPDVPPRTTADAPRSTESGQEETLEANIEADESAEEAKSRRRNPKP